MMKSAWVRPGIAGAVIILLIAGLAAYFGFGQKQAPAPGPQPVPVIAATVERHDVPIVLTGLGTVTALNTATVRSQVTGLLVSVDSRRASRSRRAICSPRSIRARIRRN